MDTSSTTTTRLRYDRTLGLASMEGRGFSSPIDLAVSSDARIYVASRSNPTQTYGIRIGVSNLDSDYFGDFGAYGSGPGEFIWPTALAFDGEDRLYLADEHNHRVTVFDTDGNYLSHWGVHGAADGELNGPAGMAFDANGDLYVSDQRNHRVQKFTADGRFLTSWGEHGSGEGQLDLPWGITVAADGDVYVADWRNDRVQRFTADGDFVAGYGEAGSGEGQLSRPASVAADADGYVYVADWGNERVQVLDRDGRFVQSLRGEAGLSKWAEEFYEANPDEQRARATADLTPELTEEVTTAYEESARIEKYFWGPCSVKLDGHGRLYVTESIRHRIQVYTIER